MKVKKPKLYTCKYKPCKKKFERVLEDQKVCSWQCGAAQAKIDVAKEEKRKSALERKEFYERDKTLKDYLKETQAVFNDYIRVRDKGKPCISCGCDMEGRKGDASHLYSVKSNPELRFNEDNVHLACVPCNKHRSGNLLEYADRLPHRIGIERYEALKADRHKTKEFTIEELIALKSFYKTKIKGL